MKLQLHILFISTLWVFSFDMLKEHNNYNAKQTNTMMDIVTIIIYMKKLLDSDWLRAVQFKCNTSAKSVTPVQKV